MDLLLVPPIVVEGKIIRLVYPNVPKGTTSKELPNS